MRLVLVDVDGTLITGYSSEARFIRYVVRRGVIGPRQLTAAIAFAVHWTPRHGLDVLKKNKAYLSGLKVDHVRGFAEAFVHHELRYRLRGELVERIKFHRRRGDTLALLTGTPEFIAQPLSQLLGIEYWRATQCVIRNGRYTSGLPLRHPFAWSKITIAEELCRIFDARLSDCIAYADSIHDRPFLERVGTAVAVAPSQNLGRVARRNGWEVLAGI